LYAAALIAYQLLVGEHPFLPKATDLGSLYEAQLHESAFADDPPGLNRATRKCLEQALEKDPERRQERVQVFGDELERAFKRASARRWRGRGWTLAVLAVCLVGAAFGLAVGLFLNK